MEINETDMNDLCYIHKGSFMVVYHFPNEIPTIMHHVDNLRFGKEFNIKISAKTYKASEDLRRFTPDNRDCFFEGERKLKYFKTYTKYLCETECLTNFSLRSCGCTHFSYPHMENEKVCGLSEDECFLNAYYNWPEMDEMSIGTAMPCNCLPTCSNIDYSFNDMQVLDLNEKSSLTIANIKNSKR